jgi:hypothetical protein
MSSSASVKLRYEKCLEIWGNATPSQTNPVTATVTAVSKALISEIRSA